MFKLKKRQDLQGKKILTVNEKYYVADHGIREAVFGGNNINLVLENIVYMELSPGLYCYCGKVGARRLTSYVRTRETNCISRWLTCCRKIPSSGSSASIVRDNFPKYVVTLDEFDMSRNDQAP